MIHAVGSGLLNHAQVAVIQLVGQLGGECGFFPMKRGPGPTHLVFLAPSQGCVHTGQQVV